MVAKKGKLTDTEMCVKHTHLKIIPSHLFSNMKRIPWEEKSYHNNNIVLKPNS